MRTFITKLKKQTSKQLLSLTENRSLKFTFILFTALIGFLFIGCQNSLKKNTGDSNDINETSENLLGPGRSLPSEVRKRLTKQVEDTIGIDLSQIKERGKLKVITMSSATSYFRYMKKWMGFEYDVVQLLAKKLNLKVEIVEAKNINDMIYKLRKGEGDFVAYQIPFLEEQEVNFNYVLSPINIRQVLIQKKPSNWRNMTQEELDNELITSLNDLNGKSVRIQNDELVEENLSNFFEDENIDITITRSTKNYGDEELIFRVLNGKIKYAIVNSLIAKFKTTHFSDLYADLGINKESKMGWLVRKKSTDLSASLTEHLNELIESGKYQEIYDKYFKEKKQFTNYVLNDKYFKATGDLSPYDSIVKTNSIEHELDWKLLTAQMYQESQFDPDAESWAGAVGLMQFMPKTAEAYKVEDRRNPVQSIEGGSELMKDLYRSWRSKKLPPEESIKFALASYNVGIGHVMDAVTLTEMAGEDTKKWEYVSQNLLKLSKREYINAPNIKYGYCNGHEPIQYVERILSRYKFYSNLK